MYVKIQTGQIIDRRTLKLEHSSISLPKEIPADWLAANGYAPLDGDIIPEIQDGQWSEPTDKAQQINGVWKRVHEVKGEAHAQPSMKDNLQSLYHKHLNGGITVNGIFIATGEADRGLINGAVARALLDGRNTKTYKFYPSGGSAIDLTNAQFKDIGRAVADHVQKCLDAAENINPSDYTTLEELEAAFVAALNS